MLSSLFTSATSLETIDERLLNCGISRRSFLVFCTSLMVAAPYGLAITDKKTPEEVAAGLGKVIRPAVIWLHFQDCTGCTESMLQTSHPGFADLILNVISLEYHETLMAGSGLQARQALDEAVQKYAGKYILVVEGSIPTKDQGIYMKLAGRPALEVLADIGGKAAAIVAIGSCASWGGIPSADPDPTGAVGVADLMPDKSIVNIPGCPAESLHDAGVLLQYAADGTLPEADEQRRPKFAFDRDIHEHCPKRAHFDAGNFVKQYGDEGHREGWCLYEMGCKGPDTHAGCSTRHFNEIPDVWPIGIGAPCIGCTEKSVAFQGADVRGGPVAYHCRAANQPTRRLRRPWERSVLWQQGWLALQSARLRRRLCGIASSSRRCEDDESVPACGLQGRLQVGGPSESGPRPSA
jgi:hydrogenase small subunit